MSTQREQHIAARAFLDKVEAVKLSITALVTDTTVPNARILDGLDDIIGHSDTYAETIRMTDGEDELVPRDLAPTEDTVVEPESDTEADVEDVDIPDPNDRCEQCRHNRRHHKEKVTVPEGEPPRADACAVCACIGFVEPEE